MGVGGAGGATPDRLRVSEDQTIDRCTQLLAVPAECEHQRCGQCSGGCYSVQFSAKRTDPGTAGVTPGAPDPRGRS